MRQKLGLIILDEGADDDALIADLLDTMAKTGSDFTDTFRRLATFPMPVAGAAGSSGASGATAAPTAATAAAEGEADAQTGSGRGEASTSGGGPSLAAAAVAAAGGGGGGEGREGLGFDDGGLLEVLVAEGGTPEQMSKMGGAHMPYGQLQVREAKLCFGLAKQTAHIFPCTVQNLWNLQQHCPPFGCFLVHD